MKCKIEIEPLDDHYVIAAKDKQTDELIDVFTLNESGADMLKLFYAGGDISSVAQDISKMYEAPLDLILVDVKKFAEKLQKKQLL